MDILYNDIKQLNGRWSEVAKEYYEVQQLRKFYEKKEKNLAEELRSLSGNESARDTVFVYIKVFTKGRVDYKAIPELASIDMDLYRLPAGCRWEIKKI